MKKAILFTAALAVTVTCSTLSAEAAVRNWKVETIKIDAASKESCSNWIEQLKEWEVPSECFKWGTIIWQDGCMEAPETPEVPEIPETPNQPEAPEVPETPNKPEIPEMPSTPEKPNTPEIPSAPENPPSQEDTEELTFAEQVVVLVNKERAKENLSPVSIDEKIEDAALVRAKEIQTSFSHTRPNGSSFATALKEAGATYRSAGENIAWGQKTPEEVVKAWMNSSGHRANIMNPNYSRIGVGHLQNAKGTSYWVQLFAN